MAIILNETVEFGIRSVNDLCSVTGVGSLKTTFGAEETFPNVVLLP
jgi:hypothetical protein